MIHITEKGAYFLKFVFHKKCFYQIYFVSCKNDILKSFKDFSTLKPEINAKWQYFQLLHEVNVNIQVAFQEDSVLFKY